MRSRYVPDRGVSMAIGACLTVDAVIVDRDGRCLSGSSNTRRACVRFTEWSAGPADAELHSE